MKMTKKQKTEVAVPVGLIVVAAIVALISFGFTSCTRTKPPSEKQQQRALERQADFTTNVWFKLDSGLPDKPLYRAEVLVCQPLGSGMYQIKVRTHDGSRIRLALAGRELTPGDEVEVGMFRFRSWDGEIPQQRIHLIQ